MNYFHSERLRSTLTFFSSQSSSVLAEWFLFLLIILLAVDLLNLSIRHMVTLARHETQLL